MLLRSCRSLPKAEFLTDPALSRDPTFAMANVASTIAGKNRRSICASFCPIEMLLHAAVMVNVK